MLIIEFDFTLIANYFSALDRQGGGYIAVSEYCWVVNYYAQMETRMRDFL